jgi:large subunit ribosomal protein L13
MVFAEYVEKRNLNHPRKGPYYPRMPHMMLKRAVRGMIPYQKPRGREAFKRLKVDVGKPASLGDGKIEMFDGAKMKKSSKYVTLGDVSKVLGAKF